MIAIAFGSFIVLLAFCAMIFFFAFKIYTFNAKSQKPAKPHAKPSKTVAVTVPEHHILITKNHTFTSQDPEIQHE